MSKENDKGSMDLVNIKISDEKSTPKSHVTLKILYQESKNSIFNLLKLPELDFKKDK